MRMRTLSCLKFSLLIMAACSPATQEPGAPAAPATPTAAAPSHVLTKAEIDRFLAEGPEPTLRKMAPFDYFTHYRVMEATGIVDALGGEERAMAALKALGNEYERKLRGAEVDIPKMVPAAFDGGGLDSGFVGMSMGSFGGVIASSMVSGAVSSMSDQQLAELAKAGPIQLGGKDGGAELQFGEDGSLDQTIEFDGKVSEGLIGKVKIKVHIDACPDPQGKLTVTLNVDSQMGVDGKPGVGGTVHSEFKLERFLDDDAHLISDNGSTANMTLSAGSTQGDSSQSFDLRFGYGRDAGSAYQDFSNDRGFSIFRMDEVKHAAELAQQSFLFQNLIAEMMLRGMGKESPWESGRCVNLKVTSDPGKRKGIRPNTAFDIEAIPRAKSDGAPTRGTVTATLIGDSSLQPASGKVPADAKYQYAGPDKKDQTASIQFEARSKRGVGKATLGFDTKDNKAYRIVGSGNCSVPRKICNVEEPFSFNNGCVVVTHTPTSDRGGTMSFSGNGGSGKGTYTLSGTEQKLIESTTSTACFQGMGCVTAKSMATWTKIEDCEE
ncbi:MAG: hypothetical protein ACOH1L_11450 [Thermomonas sp.]